MNHTTIATLSTWVLTNFILFFAVFRYYVHSQETFYVYQLLGAPIAFSRASASCLNFNIAIVLLPVCRQFATTLRNLFGCCCVHLNRTWRQFLNSLLLLHRVVGVAILFFALIHIAAHVVNIRNFLSAYDSEDDVTRRLAQFRNGTDNYLNPITDHLPYWRVYLTYLPGITGLIMLVSLSLMFLTYMQPLRSRYYELFWSSHHAFMISFMTSAILHGCGGIVRKLKNPGMMDYKDYYYKYRQHDPQYCLKKIEYWGSISDCPVPVFEAVPPATWMWVLPSLVLFFLDKLYRSLKPFINRAKLVEVILHPSSVVELQFTTRYQMKMEPGQYVRVNIPAISRLEWHPFTLTSIPGDAAQSVHIRAIGDWTTSLYDFFDQQKTSIATPAAPSLVEMEKGEGEISIISGDEERIKQKEHHQQQRGSTISSPHFLDSLPIFIDGPYGAPSQDWFLYDVAVFIGAGIGVTPFASILKHVLKQMNTGGRNSDIYQCESRKKLVILKKVYFFWVCPQMEAFEWFHDMLEDLEAIDFSKNICSHVFLTKGWNRQASRTRSFALKNVLWERDPVTGLKRLRTEFGRPRWEKEMQTIERQHPNSAVGVFHCGPDRMADEIRLECQNINQKSTSNFNFITESFS